MKLSDIILIILFILSIAVGLWYLFGSSPTLDQTILIFVLTAISAIVITGTQNNFELKYLGKRFTKLEESFIRLANDFKEIKNKLK